MGIFVSYIPSRLQADETTLTKTGSTLSIKALGVGTAQLANASVTQAKLSNINHLQLVSSQTLGANATQVDFTGLDFNTDGRYYFEVFAIANAASTSSSLYVNADTTDANYSTQNLTVATATVTGSTTAAPILMTSYGSASSNYWIRGSAQLVNGWFEFESQTNRGHDANGFELHVGSKTSASIANITQLSFKSGAANGYKTGSIFRIYKIA